MRAKSEPKAQPRPRAKSGATGFLLAASQRLEYREIAAIKPGLPTLVFLHEGLGSASLWRDFPDALAKATGAGALIYSRLGYGWSEPLAGRRAPDYMHVEAERVLPDVLRARGISRPILIGHSDGASIALIFAGRHPDAVDSLILEAPHVFTEEMGLASIKAAGDAFRHGDLRRRLKRYHADVEGAFWGWRDAWLDPRFRAWNIEEYLATIRRPVLLLQGEDDPYGTLAQLRAIESQVSGPVQTLVLKTCGHAPHREHREATLRAMARFIGARQTGA